MKQKRPRTVGGIVRTVVLSGLVLALTAGAASPAGERTKSVRDDYKVPQFTIPYAWTKPVLDGVVNAAEWQGAMSVNALQTVGRQISARQTQFWACWDEENLYLAMRSPLRSGERLIQAKRDQSRELNVVFDDSLEFWLDAGTTDPNTGLVAFFQYLTNFAGNVWDVVQQPSVGNSSASWTANWPVKHRLNKELNAWEMELTVPRKSVYLEKPFAEGTVLRCLLARNYKRPWEQCNVEGTSSFSVSDTYSHWVLSKTAPAVHLLSVADAKAKTFGLCLAASAATAQKLKWSYAADEGQQKSGELAVEKDKLSGVVADLALDPPGKGAFRIRVTSVDGRVTYLDYCALKAFGDLKVLEQPMQDAGDVIGLELRLNPDRNYVRIYGDFINYDARADIAACRVRVRDAAGTVLGEADYTIDDSAAVRGVLRLPELVPGEYRGTLACLDKDGKVLAERDAKLEKKDPAKAFSWWKTPHGSIERVMAPWTPVTYSKGTFSVWGREMRIGPAGLPAQITSQGLPLLAGPANLVAVLADGRQVGAGKPELKTLSTADHRAVVQATSRLEDMVIETRVTVEFDGMYKVEMQLNPGKPLAIRSLRVVTPLLPAAADYLHAAGEGIRTGFFYGPLPKDKRGRIWDGRVVDSQPMRVGSFFPYLWVGSTKGGLSWFADGDNGWEPANHTPAIEFRRDSGKSTDLVLNLYSEPLTVSLPRQPLILSVPRTIVFAFQASPVKPLHTGWRMDSWWTGDTFRDFSCSGDIIWTARPFTLDKEKCRQMVAAQHKGGSYSLGLPAEKYPSTAVPYFIHEGLPGFLPEMAYFAEEWLTTVSQSGSSGGGCLAYGTSVNDYMIHNLYLWAKECGIDGYYIDNMRPIACGNMEAGRGWRLPDGRVQPTYQMFGTRDYFLRMRAAFLEANGRSKIVLHMTNNMILPWVGPADIGYDGEHHVIYPEMEKDFMDFWGLDRLRSDYGGALGVAVNFMHEYQGPWGKLELAKAMRAYTGLVALQDALPSGNANGLNQTFWQARDHYGITDPAVRFIGYWDTDAGVTCVTKDVHVAAWVRPGKALLLVVNKGAKTLATVTLDPKKLGLPKLSACTVTDAELPRGGKGGDPKSEQWQLVQGQYPVNGCGDNRLHVPVERHDYRQVMIEVTKP